MRVRQNSLPAKATSASGTEEDVSKQNEDDDDDVGFVERTPLSDAEMEGYMDEQGVEAPADMGRNDPK